jgi:hypothetical protein
VLAKFIKLAKHLLNLNNFNAVMAILAALNMAAVHRLRFTWEMNHRNSQQCSSPHSPLISAHINEMYTEVESVMSTEGSFKIYRELLNKSSGACIPYL